VWPEIISSSHSAAQLRRKVATAEAGLRTRDLISHHASGAAAADGGRAEHRPTHKYVSAAPPSRGRNY